MTCLSGVCPRRVASGGPPGVRGFRVTGSRNPVQCRWRVACDARRNSGRAWADATPPQTGNGGPTPTRIDAVNPAELSAAVLAAVAACLESGEFDGTLPDEAHVERPKNREHGDYATNVALQLAKPAGMPPREVAEAIAARLRERRGHRGGRRRRPGLPQHHAAPPPPGRARPHRRRGRRRLRPRRRARRAQRINLEFVSANPTGPVHLGGIRWAAVGDALGRVLTRGRRRGHPRVLLQRRRRADRPVRRVAAAPPRTGEPAPEDGYAGDYIADIAAPIVAAAPGRARRCRDDEALEVFRGRGRRADVRRDQAVAATTFGVDFDVYFNENDAARVAARVEQALDAAARAGPRLRRRRRDLAAHHRLRRRQGPGAASRATASWTYFAADCAYYLDKRERGFDRLHLHARRRPPRLRRPAARRWPRAFGDDPERNLEVLIGQLVNLLRDGEPVRMCKRAGTVVTLEDLVDAVGVDAARYALSRYSHRLAARPRPRPAGRRRPTTTRSSTCSTRTPGSSSLLRNAAELGIDRGDGLRPGAARPRARRATCSARWRSSRGSSPPRPSCASRTGSRATSRTSPATYHRFYDACRVLPQGDEAADRR